MSSRPNPMAPTFLFVICVQTIGERHTVVKEVRGRGLMIAMEFEGGDERFSLASVYHELVARGFLVGFKPAANLLRFYPPLTIKEEDIAQLLENLDDVLEGLT